MKFLKLKSIFFSLMAIALVTVFLTSCEKEIIIEEESFKSKTSLESHTSDNGINSTNRMSGPVGTDNGPQLTTLNGPMGTKTCKWSDGQGGSMNCDGGNCGIKTTDTGACISCSGGQFNGSSLCRND